MSPKRVATAPAVDFSATPTDRLAPAAIEEVLSGDSREGELLSGDATGSELTGCSFLDCRFDSVMLTDAELRGSRFVETVFEAPFAHTLKAARTTWRDVRVENPRWGSAELFDSDIDSVHLRGGKIDYLNLRGSRLQNLIIEGCMITDLDLGDARAARVAFVDCRIGTLDLTRASCNGVDLRTSEFAALHGISGMAGVIIDDLQLSLFAPLFAEHLGVKVEG